MSYKIFGCKINKYFAEKWISEIKDGFLIASCVVTDRAKEKFIKYTLKKLKEGKKVYLTGCGVFNNGNIYSIDELISIYPQFKEYKENIVLLGQNIFQPTKSIYTKKFILIQNGCDTYCTYCYSIYKRGKHYYRSSREIIDEINQFVKNGGKEVVLTGMNLGAWGADSTLEEGKLYLLLDDIFNYTNINRIRISSLGPEFIDDKLLKRLKDNRILGYFHISIQSFSDKVLYYMKRRYNYDKLKYILENLKYVKNYPVGIGADIIVGFPYEEEKDYNLTVDSIFKFGINKLHVFPFSPHNKYGTVPASFFPQISQKIKTDRVKKLIKLGEEIRKNFILSNIGLSYDVLIEERKSSFREGLTPNYITVKINNAKRGEIINITLSDINFLS